ncbi:Alpha-glucosidase 2 [Olea europaea subsp. europaea]|uniref:Alpha-glucosidase 2 n=1 Tax=Olea europaea subsp. europaea TaxID=158383 RepID=A0A8S0T739_OLEEU|nr:Alpha-glucosidase 2 [Olea europaea subsp. europaea]
MIEIMHYRAFLLEIQKTGINLLPNFMIQPTFRHFQRVTGEQRVNIELPVGTSFYGTGEVSGGLERTGKRIFTWNTDSYGYGVETTSLYQSHPWVLAVLPNGKSLEILADTTKRCEIDLRKTSNIRIVSPSPYPLITFGPFSSTADVLMSFSHAVGTVFMPPKWSLGYQQCRCSYSSDARVREVWPGPCVFPDFTKSEAHSWWASLVKDFVTNGADGLWNDMNEPAVKTETKTMPESNIHRGDLQQGGKQNHSHYHNVYGMLMARSTYEGMKLAKEQKRPFVLTRAGFVGSQRGLADSHIQGQILVDLLGMQHQSC